MTDEQLQELTADIAEAIQLGCKKTCGGHHCFGCSPRLTCEVINTNEILITESDDKQYVVTIKERNNE